MHFAKLFLRGTGLNGSSQKKTTQADVLTMQAKWAQQKKLPWYSMILGLISDYILYDSLSTVQFNSNGDFTKKSDCLEW